MGSRSRVIRQRETGHASRLRGAAGIGVVLVLIALEFVASTEPASAQPPTTTVLVPSNNATVSGTEVALDASASPGTTQVQFEVNGGALFIATATPTIYGWVALWNSTTLPNGTYALQSVASANAVSQPSTAVTITVSNPAPSTLVVLPANGATVSGSQYLDALASPGVTQVLYEISGGPNNYVDLGISGSTPTYVGWIGSWNTASVPNGTYILNSVDSFADGASGTSPPITVVLNNPVTLADLAQPSTGSFAGTSGTLQVMLVANANSPATTIPFTGSVTASSIQGAHFVEVPQSYGQSQQTFSHESRPH